jgi:hypothetical protein
MKFLESFLLRSAILLMLVYGTITGYKIGSLTSKVLHKPKSVILELYK